MNQTKIASLGRQEPQPAGITKWVTTLIFGKILGTTSGVRSIQNPRNVVTYDAQAMISYKLFSYFDALEQIVWEI